MGSSVFPGPSDAGSTRTDPSSYPLPCGSHVILPCDTGTSCPFLKEKDHVSEDHQTAWLQAGQLTTNSLQKDDFGILSCKPRRLTTPSPVLWEPRAPPERTCALSSAPHLDLGSSPVPVLHTEFQIRLVCLFLKIHSQKKELTFLHCWWECKLASLWRRGWRFLKKLKIELPYDPAIPLLGRDPEKMKTLIRKDTRPQRSPQHYSR